MGTKNNVNPDHYKEQGRERPGQDINQEVQKQKYTQATNDERIANSQPRTYGKAAAGNVSERPAGDLENETGQISESANSSSNR